MTFRATEAKVTMYLWQNANTVVIGRTRALGAGEVESMRRAGRLQARQTDPAAAQSIDLGNLNLHLSPGGRIQHT